MDKDYKKLYEEALKRATKLAFTGNISAIAAGEIFHELRESEDEKIRKEIIKLVQFYYGSSLACQHIVSKDDMIAWLEKQKHDGKKWIYEDEYIKDKERTFQDGIDEVLENPQKYGLEKQGTPAKLSEEEQNRFAKGVLSNCAISFIDYLDAHKYEGKMCVSNGECEDIENAFQNAMWDKLHGYYCKYIEKQGEQKPAPKFKIGDTIRHKSGDDISYTIVDIVNDYYICDNKHSWSISSQDYFELVEQKPAWSEEDERILNKIQDHLREFYVDKKGYPYVAKLDSPEVMENNWLKSIKDRVQPQSRQEWSKEDSERLARIRQFILANRKGDTDEIYQQEQDADWLMKLNPQPKQKWNAQDETFLSDAIYAAENTYSENCGQEELIDWLKSLKPNRWKPSEFQLECLRRVIPHQDTEIDNELEYVLTELYDNLKKL